MVRRRPKILAATLVAVVAGCAPMPINPSFPVTEVDGSRAFDAMEKSRAPLKRPIVLVGGFGDPGFSTNTMRGAIEPTFTAPRLHDHFKVVSLGMCTSFDECRDAIIDGAIELGAVQVADDGSDVTIEVDVVAHSMGGLAARYAAMPPGDRVGGTHSLTRLRVARMYTIATPHRGANFADADSGFPLLRDMAPGSAFLRRLDAALPGAEYELVCYARLGDSVVGAENCAPPGTGAYWIATPALEFAHLNAFGDHRILADIARRLREELPLSLGAPAPYPTESSEPAAK